MKLNWSNKNNNNNLTINFNNKINLITYLTLIHFRFYKFWQAFSISSKIMAVLLLSLDPSSTNAPSAKEI